MPASQVAALVRSMAFSSISLTWTSPTTADGSVSPVPSDGSITPVPSDGSVGLHGGVGMEALCSKFCCCHDEETVVLRCEKREIDKQKSIHDPSIVSSCVVLHDEDEQFAEHEKVTDVY